MEGYQPVETSRSPNMSRVPDGKRNPNRSVNVSCALKSFDLKEATMPRAASSKIDKIEHPQSHYATPDELVDDRDLSREEKLDALKIWEQDARQMLTASNEGMPGSDEGIDPRNHHMLGQVERARDKLQRASKPKASRGRK
jgi:hypothetical protein